MKYLKSIRNVGFAFLLVFILSTCDDFLSVENPNAPDRERALSMSEDIENLIGSSFFTWWKATQNQPTDLHLSVAANETVDRYNQYSYGVLDCQREPWNNDPAYEGKAVTEIPWFDLYKSLQSANEGIAAIKDGTAIGEDGERTPRALAFGRFVQGLSQGWLALMFDRAFIVDENVETSEFDMLELKNYQEVMDVALNELEIAAQIADTSSFTLPENWINGNPMDSDRFARLIRSYMARYMISVPRTPDERENVDWGRVIQLVENGIQEDFSVMGDGLGTELWGDFNLKFIAQFLRADYLTLGPADTTDSFNNWLNSAPQEREPFEIHTNDRRIAGTDSSTAPGKYYIYEGPSGGAGFYRDNRYNALALEQSMNGPLAAMYIEEMNLIKAEALLWLNQDINQAVELINLSRVDNGELSAASANDGVGSWDDDQNPLPDGSLWAKLKHEKRIELYATSTGIEFFDDRGWGDLAKGTPLHYPIPAQELITLSKEVYTFGGEGGNAASERDLVTCPPF